MPSAILCVSQHTNVKSILKSLVSKTLVISWIIVVINTYYVGILY